jgi:histidine triad (HIT) family protein
VSGHLQLPASDDCSFCAYPAGRRPFTILSRTGTVAILVTREQRGHPHVLVLPTRHVPTILDLGDADAADLILEVRRAARLIDTAYARRGIAIWQNNGVPASQTIAHLHVHVAGTLPDRGGTDWGPVPRLPLPATEAIATRRRDSQVP